MVAALPVIAAGAETNWQDFHEAPGARPEFSLGNAFVAANGKRAFWLVTLARLDLYPIQHYGRLRLLPVVA